MTGSNYDMFTTIVNSFSVILSRFPKIFTILLIKLGLHGYLIYLLYNKVIVKALEDHNQYTNVWGFLKTVKSTELILFFILLMIVEAFFSSLTISIMMDHLYNNRLNIIKQIKFSLKNIVNYILGSLLFAFFSIIFILIFVIMMLIPIINILVLLGGIVLIFYLLGYYRFAPIIAFIERSPLEIFDKSKRLIEGHLTGSIGLLIIFGVFDYIMNKITDSTLLNAATGNETNIFGILLITYLVTIIVQYLASLCDTSYVLLGYKEKYSDITISSEEGIKYIDANKEDNFKLNLNNLNNNTNKNQIFYDE